MRSERAHGRAFLQQRRRLLNLLGGLGILALGRPGPERAAKRRPEPSLREADFYRPHDLAG
jgi:hypothetical protein